MSSKRRIRRNACTGKQQFKTSQEGLDALLSMKRRTGDSARYNVYRCAFCKQFHYGHTPARHC